MLASAIGLGIIAGLATGGKLSRLADVHIGWWPVLALAVLVRVGAGFVARDLATAAYVIGFAGIVAVAVVNRNLPGASLIALGAGLNLVVVALNGAMPVSRDAIAAVGGSFPSDPLHTELGPSSRLGLLADVIPFPVISTAYSVGDVFLAIGGGWLAYRSLRRA